MCLSACEFVCGVCGETYIVRLGLLVEWDFTRKRWKALMMSVFSGIAVFLVHTRQIIYVYDMLIGLGHISSDKYICVDAWVCVCVFGQITKLRWSIADPKADQTYIPRKVYIHLYSKKTIQVWEVSAAWCVRWAQRNWFVAWNINEPATYVMCGAISNKG